MDIQEETYKLLGQKLLEDFDSKKMVEWAVTAMKLGHDSESLVILSGLDYDSTEEREEYFLKSIEELKLNIEVEESQLIYGYSIYIANAVLDNQISPKNGLRKMSSICRFSEYESKYIPFYQIEEDIEYLEYGEFPPIYNQDITHRNVNIFIKKEFEIFLEFEGLVIDNEIRKKAFCNSCKQIIKQELKKRYQLKKPFIYQEWVCGNCKSNKVDPFSSQIGRERILSKIKTTHNNVHTTTGEQFGSK